MVQKNLRVSLTCHNTFGISSGQLAGNLLEDDSLVDLDDLFIQHLRNSHLLKYSQRKAKVNTQLMLIKSTVSGTET